MGTYKKYAAALSSLCIIAFAFSLAAGVLAPTPTVQAQNLHRSRFQLVQPQYLKVEKTTELVGDVTIGADLTASSGDWVLTLGDLTLTDGNLTLTDGDADLTLGDLTLTDGDLTLTDGDAAISGNIELGGSLDRPSANTTALSVNAAIAFAPGTTATITAGLTIPHSDQTLVLIDAAGSVSTSASKAIADGTVTGQLLKIINMDSNAITVKDGATTDLGGADVVLGGTDVLQVTWTGTTWLRDYNTDN